MIRKFGLGASILVCALVSSSAQTPKEILAKSSLVYKSAKTYQAEYTQNMDNDLIKMQVVAKIKSEGTKYRLEIITKNRNVTTQQQMISDGKTVTVFMPVINQYSTSPVKGGLGSSQSTTPLFRIQGAMGSKLKRLPDTILDGIPVYVLEAKYDGGKSTSTLSIDKKNYRLKRVINQVDKTKFVETYHKETFNAPIPSQTFVFTPPTGAKRLQ